MIPKSGSRFSDRVMRLQKSRMIPKSGSRSSDEIMRLQGKTPESGSIGLYRTAVMSLGRTSGSGH